MRTFRKALQGTRLAVTAELALSQQQGLDDVLRGATILSGSVDAIQLADHPLGQAQASPVALANLLLQQGIDATPWISCRDRNRIALQSDLLGLRAAGVTSLLLTEGAYKVESEDPPSKPVFDIHCQELIAMAHAINEEEWPESEHEFVIGTGVEACLPGPDREADVLLARAHAGARFIQTRLCLDLPLLRRYMQRLVETKVTWHCSVVVTLAPLPSADSARWLVNNLAGTLIPDELIRRMDDAPDPQQEGIDICVELLSEIAEIPGTSGVNLLCLENPEAVLSSIKAAGL